MHDKSPLKCIDIPPKVLLIIVTFLRKIKFAKKKSDGLRVFKCLSISLKKFVNCYDIVQNSVKSDLHRNFVSTRLTINILQADVSYK